VPEITPSGRCALTKEIGLVDQASDPRARDERGDLGVGRPCCPTLGVVALRDKSCGDAAFGQSSGEFNYVAASARDLGRYRRHVEGEFHSQLAR
jgi:hypothetical protein